MRDAQSDRFIAAALRKMIAADSEPEIAAAAAAMPESFVFSHQFSVNAGRNMSNMAKLRVEITITSQ